MMVGGLRSLELMEEIVKKKRRILSLYAALS
jgi:hypothetical protein